MTHWPFAPVFSTSSKGLAAIGALGDAGAAAGEEGVLTPLTTDMGGVII